MPPEIAADGLLRDPSTGISRCAWSGSDPLYCAYHDDEWGRPVDDDHRLFEKICLEGFQSGLAWITILRKRDAFRDAFDGFEFDRVARFDQTDVRRLLGNAGIVRHRGKIEAAIGNAVRARELADEFGSLAAYFWGFAPRSSSTDLPAPWSEVRQRVTSPEAIELARDLKRRGWRFVGPTTVYAFMQSMGMVNDHVAGCHAHSDCARLRASFPHLTDAGTANPS